MEWIPSDGSVACVGGLDADAPVRPVPSYFPTGISFSV